MKKKSSFLFKDTIIILFIILVFVGVILILYTEIIKKNDIRSAKNNFFFVKKEILKSINECNDKSEKWIFGGLCSHVPEKENMSQYFNTVHKLINPHDNNNGVEGSPGSVLIKLEEGINRFILSIDTDANGGIDIEQKIKY